MNNNSQLPSVNLQANQSNGMQVYDPNLRGVNDDDEIDLRALWQIAVRYRKLIALIFSVVVVTAVIISLLLRPMYEATVSIELNTSGRSIVKFQNVENQDLGTREYIQTQSNILESDPVAKEVIRQLDLI